MPVGEFSGRAQEKGIEPSEVVLKLLWKNPDEVHCFKQATSESTQKRAK